MARDDLSSEPPPAPPNGFLTPRAAFGAFVALVMVAAIVTAIEPGWGTLMARVGAPTVTVLLSVLVSLMLTAVPVCLCLVQGVARGRQLEKLDALQGHPVARTLHFRAARMRVAAVRPVTMGYDYLLPMLVFSGIVLFCSIGAWCAFLEPFFFDRPSPVLGGTLVADRAAQVEAYQRGTFVAGVTAFLGAYTYVLFRLLERLNLDDISPITFYRYAAHILVAAIVAGIVRHSADALGIADGNWLIPVSFVIGLSPDLFITAVKRQVLRRWKIAGMRDDPAAATLATALPLTMVDDMKPPQVDRLAELGVLSAQDLARRNPFLLWARVPFEIGQLLDWIAQAQLYALVREDGLPAMRRLMVRDIFGLHLRLSVEATRGPTCAALGLPPEAGEALLLELENDLGFTLLRETQDALRPPAQGAAAADAGGPGAGSSSAGRAAA